MGIQGFQGEATNPRFSLLRACKEIKLLSHLYATKQVSDNENVHHRQTKKGYRYYTQGNLTRTSIILIGRSHERAVLH